MKKLKYQVRALRSEWDPETETDVTIEDAVGIEVDYSDAALAHALEVAIDGRYEIVDDGEPEAEPVPTNAELAAENKLLRQQVAALTDQNDFQEELIVELAEVVYA